MARPAFNSAGAGSASATLAGSQVQDCPATVAAGDLLVCYNVLINENDDAAATMSTGGWTAFPGNTYLDSGGANVRIAAWWKPASGSEGGTTITTSVTGGTSLDHWHGRVLRFTCASGFHATTPVEDADKLSGAGGNTVSLAPTTASGADRLAVCILAGYNSTGAYASATGESGGDWTEATAEFLSTLGSDGGSQVQTAALDSATISGGTAGTLTSDSWISLSFCLVPAAANPDAIVAAGAPTQLVLTGNLASVTSTPNTVAPRIYWYEEVLGRTTSVTTDYSTVKLTKAFTPTSGRTYAIIWSAILDGDTADLIQKVRLRNTTAGVTLSEPSSWVRNTTIATSNFPVGGLALFTAASGTAQTIEIQVASSTASLTLGAQEARLLIIELVETLDQWATVAGSSNLSSTTYTTKAGLSWTPASSGNYLTLATADVLSGSPGEVKARLYIDGATPASEAPNFDYNSGAEWMPYTAAYRHSAITGPHTAELQYGGVTTAQVSIRNAYIVSFRLDQFLSSFWAEQRTPATSTSATFVDMASVTNTPNAVDYAILACGNADLSTGTNYTTSTANRIAVNTTGQGTVFSHVAAPVSPYKWHWFQVLKRTETAASTVWSTQQARSVGTSTAESDEHVLAILQIGSTSGDITATAGAPTSLALTGQAPAVTAGAVAAPSTQALALAGQGAVVTVTPDALLPGTGSLALLGSEPSILATVDAASAGAQALTLTGQLASASAPQSVSVTADVSQALALAGQAATITSTPNTLTPESQALSLGGFAPSLLSSAVAEPTTQAMTLTGFAPSIEETVTVLPTTGALALTGHGASVAAGAVASPGTGSLLLAGSPPALLVSSAAVSSAAQALFQTGQAVTIAVGDGAFAEAPSSLALSGFAPTPAASSVASPTSQSIIITGFQPTVSTAAAVLFDIPEAASILKVPFLDAPAAISIDDAWHILGLFRNSLTVTNVTANAGSPQAIGIFGQPATVIISSFALPSTGTVIITGAAPTIVADSFLDAGSQALTITGNQPQTAGGADVSASAAQALFLTGLAATSSVSVGAFPESQALTIAGQATSVTSTPEALTPAAGSLVLTGQAATAEVAIAVVAGASQQLIITGQQATAESPDQNIPVGAPSVLTLTGAAPALLADATIVSGFSALAISSDNVSLSAGAQAIPITGVLLLSGLAPVASASNILAAGTGALVITGHAPSVLATVAVAVGAPSALLISGQTASYRSDWTVIAETQALMIAGLQPTVTASSIISAGAGALIITGLTPSVATFTSDAGPTQQLTITGFAPESIRLDMIVGVGSDALVLYSTGRAVTEPFGSDLPPDDDKDIKMPMQNVNTPDATPSTPRFVWTH